MKRSADAQSRSDRRKFLRNSAVIAGGLAFAPLVHAESPPAPRRGRLNVAFVGPGGRGADNLKAMSSENVVALCDVDEVRAKDAYAAYPQAHRYRDFREMLDKEKSLDAVVVSTPDHTHAAAAIAAMKRGLHVYCEKPLAHSIDEVRTMRRVAAEMGVVTQMGTQGHAMEGTRRAVEVIRSGLLGEVRELHVWTDRPNGWWPQGEDRPPETPPVPATLDWDLWLGPAPQRPYHPTLVPFSWRGRWDFGTGAIGDMGVHNLDTAYWALELGFPTAAEVVDSAPKTEDCPPLWSIIALQFPENGSRPPVKLTFYDGKRLPPKSLFHGEPIPDNGSLVVGSRATLMTRTWHGGLSESDMFLLIPREEFADLVPPPISLPRTPDHHREFILACKGGPRTESHFGYASQLTESLLVGSLALRMGQRITWDAKNMRATGCPDADQFIRPSFRRGWF
ncbi:MAG: Gfo/Idh/MocA family oxidoreductase [Planctomycetales bacterium]|nr:Gfo/Idh/MocA family oxidoreductase [Planctomycetales bacterium]